MKLYKHEKYIMVKSANNAINYKELNIVSVSNHTSHMETAVQRKYACGICRATFCLKRRLQLHKKICHKSIIKYMNCNTITEQEADAEVNKAKCKYEEAIKCDVCGKVFKQKERLVIHMRGHSQEKHINCSTITEQKADAEVNNAKRKYQEVIKCDICGKAFKQTERLGIHMRVHSKGKHINCNIVSKQKADIGVNKEKRKCQEVIKCDVCGKVFKQKERLVIHMRVHSKEKPYECEICCRSFSQQGNCMRHKRVHTAEKPYVCEICYKRFSQKGNLSTHKRIHTGFKPYKCEICDKAFTQAYHLTSHRRIHTEEKPFACEVCHKAFAQKGQLNVHERIHSHAKPYRCEICQKSFAQAIHMVAHKHVNEKPFKCETCGRTFLQKGHLSIHEKVHNKAKPYECFICNKAFKREFHLANHEKKHFEQSFQPMSQHFTEEYIGRYIKYYS